MAAIFPHVPVLRYVAECETRSCTWSEKHVHEDEALDAMRAHKAAHEIRHTCSYDEHAGFIGRADCTACRWEDARAGVAS